MLKKLLFFLALMMSMSGNVNARTWWETLKTWDFTTMSGDITWGSDLSGKYDNRTLTACTGNLEGLALFNNGWSLSSSGLGHSTSGNRPFAILNLSKGDKVTVTSNKTISTVTNASGENNVFTAKADGLICLNAPRGDGNNTTTYITAIKIERQATDGINEVNAWDFTTWDESLSATSGYKSYSNVSSASNLSGLVFENTSGGRFYTRTDGTGYIQMLGTTIKVPVTAGQIVTFNLQSIDEHQAIYTIGGNTNGGDFGLVYDTERAAYYTATSDGYITITSTNNYCRINSITLEDAPSVYFSSSTCVTELIDMNCVEPTLYYPVSATSVTYEVSNTKIAKIGGEEHAGDLMLLNTGICGVTATVVYKGNTYTASYTLTIKADDATYEINGETYTLTGAGKLQDRVVTGVPKITMEFGENTDNVTNITIVRNLDGVSVPVASTIDENGWQQLWYNATADDKILPYQGSYYTFKPVTNGQLTVKGYLNRGSAYIVDEADLAPVPHDQTAKVFLTTESWVGSSGLAATQYAPAVEIATQPATIQMVEKYEDTVETTGNIMTQTITGLSNGTYRVDLFANATYTPGRNIAQGENNALAFEDGATDIAYVFANGAQTPITAVNATMLLANGEYSVETQVTDGTLTIGLGKWKGGTNWHTIQIKALTLEGASTTPFVPVANITTAGVSETTIEVERGHTYYLYGNIPSTNNVNVWSTYMLNSFSFLSDFRYDSKSIVLERDATEGGQQIIGVSSDVPEYTAVAKGDITGYTLNADGTVSGITGEGGAIIVTASLKEGGQTIDSDYYVITVPYKNKTWDFHTTVPSDMDPDLDWAVNYEVRDYDLVTRALLYLNEPILTAAQGLEGNNAYYIGETAGLVVDAAAKTFGVRGDVDNLGDVDKYNAAFGTSYTADEFAELKQDGSFVDTYLKKMLAYSKEDVHSTNIPAMKRGSVITLPKLRKGTYVAYKAFRHAPNNGDYIQFTNVTDLEGNTYDGTNNMTLMTINQTWRGSSVYDAQYGWIVFKVAEDGDVTLRVTDTDYNGWTHIKKIAVAETFNDLDNVTDGFDTDLMLAKENASANVGSLNNLSPTTFYYDGTSMTYTFYNSPDANVRTCQENQHIMKFYLEDIKGFGDYSYEEEGSANSGSLANHVKRANPTIKISEEGVLSVTGGHGSVVVVQKVMARNDNYWSDRTASNYVIDINKTKIYIIEPGNTTQTYPYTWDFTNVQTDLSSSDNWADTDNDGTYSPTEKGKNEYVQNSELVTTDGDDIDEFDGLGFITSVDENGISADGLDNVGIKTGGEGDKGLVVGNTEETTIVVPDVPEGATVYIRLTPNSDDSSVKGGTGDATLDPESEGGYSASDLTPTNVNLDNTGQNTYEIPGDGGDVNITVKDVTIEGIAVTNIYKECKFWDKVNGEKEDGSTISGYEGFYCYNSDSHDLAINYPLTKYYTGTFMNAMYVSGTSKSDDKVFATTVPINITPSTKTLAGNGITLSESEGFGVLVYSVDYDVNHPLFVPAIHDNPDVNTNENNMLIGIYEAKSLPASSESDYLYVFTNLYTQSGASSKTTSDIPGFFKVNSAGTLKANRAYLPLASSEAPQVNSIFITPYEGYYDCIEEVKGVVTDADGTFHTITGIEIQGKPSQRGVYIQNGKKVLVK